MESREQKTEERREHGGRVVVAGQPPRRCKDHPEHLESECPECRGYEVRHG